MSPHKLRFIFVCAFVCALTGMTDKAKAQGIERVSLSGENLAEQLRQSGVNQTYNMRLGPVTLRVEADTSISYNDNINLAKTGRISDFVVTPSFEIHAQ